MNWTLSMPHGLDDLAIVFLAQNEEHNLRHTVPAAAAWGVPVYVIDGGSSDGSEAVCVAAGAVVLRRPFDHWASQRNWALRHPEIQGAFILFLDADELVTEELRRGVSQVLATERRAGWYVNRRVWFLGRPLRHCGLSPNWVLRLVRRDAAHWEPDGMREFAVVDGVTGRVPGLVEHRDHRGVLFWTTKHVWLAGLEAGRHRGPHEYRDKHLESRLRRVVRRRVFSHLPPAVPALALFLYRYVVRLGFMDGHAGFSYCMMRELWFPVLVADVHAERGDGLAISDAQVERLRAMAFGRGW
jgi:glycosyltransferase involved in cell wall biosynthesis